jgi:hypothetical protein
MKISYRNFTYRLWFLCNAIGIVMKNNLCLLLATHLNQSVWDFSHNVIPFDTINEPYCKAKKTMNEH